MTAVRHGRPPGGVHRIPRTSAPSGDTSRIDSRGISTPGSSSGSGQKPRPNGRAPPTCGSPTVGWGGSIGIAGSYADRRNSAFRTGDELDADLDRLTVT